MLILSLHATIGIRQDKINFFVLFYCMLFFPCFWSSVLLSEIASKMSPNDTYQLLYGLLPHPQEFFCVTCRILQNVMSPSDIVIQDLTLFPSEYACTGDSQMPCLEHIHANPVRKPMWQGTEGNSQQSCIIQAVLESWKVGPLIPNIKHLDTYRAVPILTVASRETLNQSHPTKPFLDSWPLETEVKMFIILS